MAPDAVASSALWVAAARAEESARADRLFCDGVSAQLAGPEGIRILEVIRGAGSDPVPFIAVRTRFFDDLALASGLRQIVAIGAGMDTRAFRLPWPPGTRVFEVDRGAQLARKAERLGAAVPMCERVAVAADLSAAWLPVLAAAGFTAAEPTMWLLEGITMYFDAAGVHTLLAAITSASATGSRLGVDFIGTAIVRPPHQRFGCDEPVALLEPLGWRCTVAQPGEPGAHFGRWPHPPLPASVMAAHRAHFVAAVKPLDA